MMVKVYSAPGCPWCSAVKNFLKEHNIAFEEIDVSDPKNAEEFIKKTGQMSVPVIDIDGELVIGFDQQKLKEKLDIYE